MTHRPMDTAVSSTETSPHTVKTPLDVLASDEVAESSTPSEPTAVSMPLPLLVVIYQTVAFTLSALLSPYLVIPFGTVGIIASLSLQQEGLIKWTLVSVFFSTVVPALFVVIQIFRGRITDVHVMEREQRSGPFLVAVVSCAMGAAVLYKLHAPTEVWSLTAVMAVNGIILYAITSFWKISMHVAVLSSTVLAATMIIPEIGTTRIACMVWMVPALIWARVTRQRHSVLQGLAACLIAGAITGSVLTGIRYFATVGAG